MDEAQLHNEKRWNISDFYLIPTIFKFVMALHRFFVESKLLSKGQNQLLSMFSDQSYKLIHQFTNGRIMETMKFIYRPSKLNYKKFKQKHIEMVAIGSGCINV